MIVPSDWNVHFIEISKVIVISFVFAMKIKEIISVSKENEYVFII